MITVIVRGSSGFNLSDFHRNVMFWVIFINLIIAVTKEGFTKILVVSQRSYVVPRPAAGQRRPTNPDLGTGIDVQVEIYRETWEHISVSMLLMLSFVQLPVTHEIGEVSKDIHHPPITPRVTSRIKIYWDRAPFRYLKVDLVTSSPTGEIIRCRCTRQTRNRRSDFLILFSRAE